MKKKIIRSVILSLTITVVLAAAGIFFLPSGTEVSGQQQSRGWRVWVKETPCSGRFDWLAVARENPPPQGGGLSTYVPYETVLGRAPVGLKDCLDSNPTLGCTFAEAETLRDALRFNSKFADYCCRDYSVWQDNKTGKKYVALVRTGTTGDEQQFVKGNLCCDEAEAIAGTPGACSGYTGGGHGGSCFASDPGMGSANRDDHYNWAQRQDASRLEANLKSKINLLYNCSSLSDDDFANAFADFSVTIGKSVPNAACFGNDRGAISSDRNAHYQWAKTKSRQQVLQNLQWKMATALKCLDSGRQKTFFADLSVPIARISPTSQTNATNTGGTRGNNTGDKKVVEKTDTGSVSSDNKCALAGTWSHSTSGVGSSSWTITDSGKATESGLGGASGTASLSGKTLRIDWSHSNGWSGYYEWELDTNCRSVSGRLVFKSGGSGTHTSTVKRQ